MAKSWQFHCFAIHFTVTGQYLHPATGHQSFSLLHILFLYRFNRSIVLTGSPKHTLLDEQLVSCSIYTVINCKIMQAAQQLTCSFTLTFYEVGKLVSGQHNDMIKSLLLFYYLSSIIYYSYIHLSFWNLHTVLQKCFNLSKQSPPQSCKQEQNSRLVHLVGSHNMTGNMLTSAEIPERGEFKATS